MNCPKCSSRMSPLPFFVGFDVVYYRCEACDKIFWKEADTLSDVAETYSIKTGKLVEVDKSGKLVQ